jgi:UDP-4-amino-4,6-dideoxy-N-acetyl-beta-L-altrosamine N-acetyltransferase
MRLSDCELRPMRAEDGPMVLAWRNQDRVRANMYTNHIIAPEEHERWFGRALGDPRAAYRIFEHGGGPMGFVSFTGIDRAHGRATWAFYLGEAEAPRGSGAAMEYLALEEAFGALGIRKLCCEVFAFNAGVVRLHQRFGFQQEGVLSRHHLKDGAYQDIVCLARFGEDWPRDRDALRSSVFKEEPQ